MRKEQLPGRKAKGNPEGETEETVRRRLQQRKTNSRIDKILARMGR